MQELDERWEAMHRRTGHPGARENLDLLNRKMHQVDIDQARELADAWVPLQLADLAATDEISWETLPQGAGRRP